MLNTREPAIAVGHQPLVTIPADATLLDAARLLHAESIGALAVQAGRELVGVISERDIVDAVGRRIDLDVASVSDHLSSPVVSARPSDTVLDVALQMLDAGTRHLPHVDDLERAQGMVSLRDLLRPLLLQAMTGQPVDA